MATKDHIDTTWAPKAWLEKTGQPIRVDYSGLKVRKTTWGLLCGQAGYRPIVLLGADAGTR